MSEQISTSPYVSYAAQLIEADEQRVFQYGVGDVITQLRNYAEKQLQTPDRQEEEDLTLAYVIGLRGLRRAMPQQMHQRFVEEAAFLHREDVHEVLVNGSKNPFVTALSHEYYPEFFNIWAAEHLDPKQTREINEKHKKQWLKKIKIEQCNSLEELSNYLTRQRNESSQWLTQERDSILEQFKDDEHKKPGRLRNSDPQGFENLIKARDLIFQGHLEDGVALVDEEPDDDLQASMYAALQAEIYEELRRLLDHGAPPREVRAKIVDTTFGAYDAERMRKALLHDYIHMQLYQVDIGANVEKAIADCLEFAPEFDDVIMAYFEPEILAKCVAYPERANLLLGLVRPDAAKAMSKVLNVPLDKDDSERNPK